MKFKLVNQMTNKYGDVITVGDYVKYTTRTDNWLHKTVRGTDCGEVVGIKEYEDGKMFVMVRDINKEEDFTHIPEHIEVKEKRCLTDTYNVSTIVSTNSNTEKEIKTHTENKTKDGNEEMINVRVLEEKIEKGLLERFALESAKQSLEKIENRTTGVDTWVLENNEGTYGTEIVITKEGHIDLYLCIMEKYSSRVSYIRVGNFQPEFGLGEVHLPSGEIKEYQKLGTIINALNKEYEKYGFYFTADTKNNRRILADARKSYELFKAEEKERKRKENLVKDLVSLSSSTLCGLLRELGHEGRVFYEDIEELERELVKFFEKSDKKYDCWQDVFEEYKKSVEVEKEVEEKITFDIDGESSSYITEKKDVDYTTAQKEYRLRLQHAPEETYNKTDFNLKINGECVYGFRVDLCKGHEHKFELAEELLRNLKFQKRVWSGEEYSWMQGEYREKRIKEQFGTEEEMMKFFDKIEKILVDLITPEPTPEPEKKTGFEVRVVNIESGEVVQTMTAPNMRTAEKIESGVLINLNREDYYVEIVDLLQSKTPEEELVTEIIVEKMEEKEMNTINKNALNNRMIKLGEFLKENKDKDAVENKVYELFPNAMEVGVFEGDNVVHFLVGQEYVGKAPTKKEMKELDFEFGELNRMYGLSVHVTVNSEKITMNTNVGVEYTDRYGHSHYTDYVVKEMEIDCNPEPEKTDELEKYIKDHIHEVIDLTIRENHNVGYMYKKTVAVKRNDRYEITSLFEDMWTGKNVYIGNDSNMLMIPNSEKSFLTDIVEKFLGSYIGIGETVEKIKEKIKRKFEYSYSKSITVKEEEEIYVLETPSGVELFWYYKDAYSRMVELVDEMSERFSNNYEVIIEDYSAKMETFSWKIVPKIIK